MRWPSASGGARRPAGVGGFGTEARSRERAGGALGVGGSAERPSSWAWSGVTSSSHMPRTCSAVTAVCRTRRRLVSCSTRPTIELATPPNSRPPDAAKPALEPHHFVEAVAADRAAHGAQCRPRPRIPAVKDDRRMGAAISALDDLRSTVVHRGPPERAAADPNSTTTNPAGSCWRRSPQYH